MLYQPKKTYRIKRRRHNGFFTEKFGDLKPKLIVLGLCVGTYYVGKLVGWFSGFVAGQKASESATPKIEPAASANLSVQSNKVVAKINSSAGPGFLYLDNLPVGIVEAAPAVSVVSIDHPGKRVAQIRYPDGKNSEPKEINLDYYNSYNKNIVHTLGPKASG
jgi:hypothetical protein